MAKRTIQTYLPTSRAPRPRGQSWATFLRSHAHEIWACDFLPVTDLLFRPLFAFFIVELATRRVVHVGTTRHPTDAWVAQQLREARLCAIPGDAKASGGGYGRRGRRSLAGADGGASRATTIASQARAGGDVSQASAASAM